jgi:hypothetical protein
MCSVLNTDQNARVALMPRRDRMKAISVMGHPYRQQQVETPSMTQMQHISRFNPRVMSAPHVRNIISTAIAQV